MEITMTPESAKRKWQLLHGQWVAAIDAGNAAKAKRLMARCDKLLPLFSITYKSKG